jgi:hypothetical protein
MPATRRHVEPRNVVEVNIRKATASPARRSRFIVRAMLAARARWALTILGLLAAGPADAHDFYARECCSGRDCRPAEPGEVVAEPGGWRVVPTGELVPQWATRRAPDGRIHRCTKDGDPHALTICLYVPDPGS